MVLVDSGTQSRMSGKENAVEPRQLPAVIRTFQRKPKAQQERVAVAAPSDVQSTPSTVVVGGTPEPSTDLVKQSGSGRRRSSLNCSLSRKLRLSVDANDETAHTSGSRVGSTTEREIKLNTHNPYTSRRNRGALRSAAEKEAQLMKELAATELVEKSAHFKEIDEHELAVEVEDEKPPCTMPATETSDAAAEPTALPCAVSPARAKPEDECGLLTLLDDTAGAAAAVERVARQRVSEWVRQLPMVSESAELADTFLAPLTPGAASSERATSSDDSPCAALPAAAEPPLEQSRGSLAAAGHRASSLGLSHRASLCLLPSGPPRLSAGRPDALPPPGRLSSARASQAAEGPAGGALPPAASRRSSSARPLPPRGSMAPAPACIAEEDAEAEAGAPPEAAGVEALERAAQSLSLAEQPAKPAKAAEPLGPVQEAEQAAEEAEAASEEGEEGGVEAEAEVAPLAALLRLCGQTAKEVLPMAAGLKRWLGSGKSVRKIGEGTFGEVFKCPGVVLKIVPMAGDQLVNGEAQKSARDMFAEAAVTLRISSLREGAGPPAPGAPRRALPANASAGFVETSAVVVARGPYAPSLLKAWRAFDREKGSESDNPEGLGPSQLYCVFVCADGGSDLEGFGLRSAGEARSLLLQVTLALAAGEQACRFEHRDLHWGNVLLRRKEPVAPSAQALAAPGPAARRAPAKGSAKAAAAAAAASAAAAAVGAAAEAAGSGCELGHCRLRGVALEFETYGIEATLIDFTLSRLDTPGGVACCNLEEDPELFNGPKESLQHETYRKMRQQTKGDWRGHFPKTNSMWLHYLADCLVAQKKFSRTAAETKALKAFRTRAARYGSAMDAVKDELFDKILRPAHT